ncbi:MAG: hypothetical protein RR731_07405 [Oscillospiraceae bacterium]
MSKKKKVVLFEDAPQTLKKSCYFCEKAKDGGYMCNALKETLCVTRKSCKFFKTEQDYQRGLEVAAAANAEREVAEEAAE